MKDLQRTDRTEEDMVIDLEDGNASPGSRCLDGETRKKICPCLPPTNGSSNTNKLGLRSLLISMLIIWIGAAAAAAILAFGITSANRDQDNIFEQVCSFLFVENDQTLSDYVVAGQWVHQAFREYRTSSQTQGDFEEVYDNLISTGLKFQAISFAMNISSEAERRAMENETRAFLAERRPEVNYTGFKQFVPDSPLAPRENAPFYFPAHIVAPINRTGHAWDVDVYTSQPRKQAIDKALRTWQPTMTEPIVLGHEADTGSDLRSVALVHPGTPLPSNPTLAPRDVSMMGIRVPDIFYRAHNKLEAAQHGRSLSIYLFDSTDSNEDPPFLGGAVFNSKDGTPRGSVLFTPETSLSSLLEGKDHHKRLTKSQVASGEWTYVAVATKEDFPPDVTFVIVSAVVIFTACTCMALWVHFHHKNLVKQEAQKAARDVEVARKAALAERNMTAYFAHELRNPIGAIDSALACMPEQLPADAQELVAGMQLCSSFMSSIMNNLLDARKIEEGKMVLHSDPLSLESLVRDVRRMNLSTVRSNVELNVLVETAGGRDWVLGDIHRLQQILNNLVTNAIKYTGRGSITLVAGWKDDLVRLECRDTGPGIPKDEQGHMFERFVMRGGAPGSGLGLSIAKQIVDLMGGSIHFESDPSVKPGTNCIVLLPLKPSEEPIVKESEPEDRSPIPDKFSILIVDDIKMNRTMLKKRIQRGVAPNCIVSEAATGEEALSICESERFDVIIIDHFMEEAGGVMVGTDAILAMRRSKVNSFIIGCSGNDLESIFLAAGADCFWGKPLPSNSEIRRQFLCALENRT